MMPNAKQGRSGQAEGHVSLNDDKQTKPLVEFKYTEVI